MSSVALGMWDDEEGEFYPKLVVPIEWVHVGSGQYSTEAVLPSNSVYTAMAVSLPEDTEGITLLNSDSNFDEAKTTDIYGVWRSLTTQSNISGSISMMLYQEDTYTINYSFE